MKLREIVEKLSLEIKTPGLDLDREVQGGYVSDLLSDVIGNAKSGYLWVTLQIHLNIIAVASLKELSGIILANDRVPDQDTVARASEQNIPVLTSSLSSFDLVGKLYELGIRCR